MSERSVTLVSELLQPQHGTIATVCERGLEEFENLEGKWRILIAKKCCHLKMLGLRFKTNLLQDVLLSHEFLSLSVGFVNHDLQNILPTVGDVHHEEN